MNYSSANWQKWSGAGICHFDNAGKCTYVNDRHITLTGRSREELLGSSWSDWVHPDDRTQIMEILEKERNRVPGRLLFASTALCGLMDRFRM